MSIQQINIGQTANDGSGETLREGGAKINANFADLDQRVILAQGAAQAAQATADAAVTNAELQSSLGAKVDKVSGKGLSTEDFTSGEKSKLAGLQPPNFRGTFTSLANLQAGVTTHFAGDYADVDAGVGSDVQRYIWDANDNKWVLGSGGGGPVNTDSLPEGMTNLYFTASRVLGVALAGLSLLSGAAVVAADSVIVAVGKLQKQITDLASAVANKASKGSNSDITALTGLTTPLSISQGGTGSASGVPDMAGASTTTAGTKGLVPAPVAGVTRFLSSLGSWRTIAFTTYFESAQTAYTNGGLVVFPHGLAAMPRNVQVYAVGVADEHGWSAGIRVAVKGLTVGHNADNIFVKVSTTGLKIVSVGSGADDSVLTVSSWRLVACAAV